MKENFPVLSSVVIPLLCGLAGGVLGATWASRVTTPAAPAAVASPDCGRLNERLDALGESLAAMRAEVTAERMTRVGGGVDGGAAIEGARKFAMEMLEQGKAQHAALRTRMEERKTRDIERKRERAAADLLEFRAVQKDSTDDVTRKNVQKWIGPLGFSAEDQQRIAEAGMPYVRQRHETIIRFLEQTTGGGPPDGEEVRSALKALEPGLLDALPSSLGADVRAGVLARINGRVRVPYYLDP